ncbi:hypothetical protein HZH68_008756 [Vespula germanica]|uniref:Uncharacterized protein n=1 Tax=Vespula germanica TaxID=30212 RepID=A0A834N7B9_VESGE|nr:hypothetical protein HZH68_008756 [Vespula germanica]
MRMSERSESATRKAQGASLKATRGRLPTKPTTLILQTIREAIGGATGTTEVQENERVLIINSKRIEIDRYQSIEPSILTATLEILFHGIANRHINDDENVSHVIENTLKQNTLKKFSTTIKCPY